MHCFDPTAGAAQSIQRPSETQSAVTSSVLVSKTFHLLDMVVTSNVVNPAKASSNAQICRQDDAIVTEVFFQEVSQNLLY